MAHPPDSARTTVLRLFLAAAAAAAATALRVSLADSLGPPYLLFYPVVMAAAVLGGAGPGLTATVVAALLAWAYILPPTPWDVKVSSGLAAFTVTGLLMTALGAWGRRAHQLAAHHAAERHRLELEAAAERREAVARERYDLLARNARDAILFARRADRRIVEANQAALELYGHSREALLALTLDELRSPAARHRLPEQLARIDESGGLYETVHQRHDGSTFGAEVSARAVHLDGTELVVSVIRDVTQRQAAVEQLASERSRLAVTLASIGDAVISTDPEARITEFNAAAEALTGWPASEARGRPLSEVFRIFGEGSGDPVESPVTRVLREGAVVGLANHTVLEARSGERRPIADSGAPIRDAAGRLLGVVLVFRDQTEERRSALALAESQRRYQELFSRAPVAMSLLRSADRVLLEVNQAFLDLFEVRREAAVGSTVVELGLTDQAGFDAVLAQVAEAGRVRNLVVSRSTRPGKALTVALSLDPVSVGAEEAFLVTIEDLTARTRAEAALQDSERRFQQAQKLEGLGRLAGGVAHDFNNLLTVILSCAQELGDQASGLSPEGQEAAKEIHVAGERAHELTRQLLAFARQQPVAPTELDLGERLTRSERMLRRLLGEDVRLEVAAQPGLWEILADAGQVDQVLMNLAVNARDAMPGGGRLRLEARNAGSPSGAGWVVLSVEDTGVGMDEATRARLFEPFFTTKAPGKGTGLGLATVYGIVSQAGGRVEVESAPGKGTRFELWFPRLTEHLPAAPPPPSAVLPVRGDETVLLVEDDPLVRGVAERALRGAGYAVLVATDPLAALGLDPALLQGVAMLVTDVVMPGLDGASLARTLRERHPALKVLHVSGYTRDAVLERGAQLGGTQLLEKPFTGQQLLERVRRVLTTPA